MKVKTRRPSVLTLTQYLCMLERFCLGVKVASSSVFPVYRGMKTYWGSGGIAPLILNLGTR